MMAVTQEQAQVLAKVLREAADAGDVSHNDLCKWLSDALDDCKQPGDWCCFQDFIGDGESGTVYFYCCGDLTSAPYVITKSDSTMMVTIDMENCQDVLSVTTYKVEGDAADMPAMEAAGKKAVAAGKKKRGAKKPFSVGKKMEAARVAEAGARHNSSDQKSVQMIHDHALKLGADPTKADPDITGNAAEGMDAEEAAAVATIGHRLVESAALSTDFQFREAAAISPLVKIISPGRGSSGYYTKEVLQRDGPQVFRRGMLMFVNHATEAEQKARPEGDWSQLAAVTEADARWDDNGPDGAALYAPAAVFSKFADEVKEKAPFTGVSINARGHYAESATGIPNPKVKFHESMLAPDGKPGLVGRITAADSIDLVTKAGRDGKLLLESAGEFNPEQENDMDAAEFKKLQESNTAMQAELRKLRDREALREAAGPIADYLRTVAASQPIKDKVTQRVLERCVTPPLTATGELDHAQVKKFAEAELVEQLDLLRRINPQLVTGMGPSGSGQSAQLTEAQREAQKEAKEREAKQIRESQERFANRMGFGGQMGARGRKIMIEGRSAFDMTYNARLRGAKIQQQDQTLEMEA